MAVDIKVVVSELGESSLFISIPLGKNHIKPVLDNKEKINIQFTLTCNDCHKSFKVFDKLAGHLEERNCKNELPKKKSRPRPQQPEEAKAYPELDNFDKVETPVVALKRPRRKCVPNKRYQSDDFTTVDSVMSDVPEAQSIGAGGDAGNAHNNTDSESAPGVQDNNHKADLPCNDIENEEVDHNNDESRTATSEQQATISEKTELGVSDNENKHDITKICEENDNVKVKDRNTDSDYEIENENKSRRGRKPKKQKKRILTKTLNNVNKLSTCDLCLKVFGSKQKLHDHKRKTHAPEHIKRALRGPRKLEKSKSFKCQYCPQRYFATKAETELHEACHSDDVFKCPYCEVSNTIWGVILSHILQKHPESRDIFQRVKDKYFGSYKCSSCPKTFPTLSRKTQHEKFHDNKEYTCEVCGKIFFTNATRFQYHVDLCKTGCGSFNCEKCDFKTTVKSIFEGHLACHEGNGHECEVCKKQFPVRHMLKQHERTHLGDKGAHVCDHCGQKYKIRSSLLVHVKRAHSDMTTGELYMCQECNFHSKLKADVARHFRFVHDKPYKCDKCDFQTASQNVFQEHEEYHKGLRPFTCEFCNYAGRSSLTLRDHVHAVHTLQKDIVCPIENCGQTFKKQVYLRRHMTKHTGEKPFRCDVCKMAFRSHATMYRHRARVHPETAKTNRKSRSQPRATEFQFEQTDLGPDGGNLIHIIEDHDNQFASLVQAVEKHLIPSTEDSESHVVLPPDVDFTEGQEHEETPQYIQEIAEEQIVLTDDHNSQEFISTDNFGTQNIENVNGDSETVILNSGLDNNSETPGETYVLINNRNIDVPESYYVVVDGGITDEHVVMQDNAEVNEHVVMQDNAVVNEHVVMQDNAEINEHVVMQDNAEVNEHVVMQDN
ncbi:unnamed protein product, partial [Owenia fusiformis]